MPTTQYIGARYVPLIYQNPDDNSNDWKAGVAYEPLTIVSYAGGSYTSKTFVPAAATNPIDAPEYWVSIGLYSGQTSINTNSIIQIRHAMAPATEAGSICTQARTAGDWVWVMGTLYECLTNIAVNDPYTDGVNVTAIDLKAYIDSILPIDTADINDDAVTTAKIDDSAVTSDKIADGSINKAKMVPDKYVLIGDSWNSSLHYSWGANIISELGLTQGVDVWNIDIPGGGMANGIMLSGTTSAISGMTTAEKESITKIAIVCGANDAAKTSAAIISGLTAYEAFLVSNFPNADIYLIAGQWMYSAAGIREGLINAYNVYAENVTKIKFIDKAYLLFQNPKFLDTDMIHPTATGNVYLANSIRNILNGGTAWNKTYSDLIAKINTTQHGGAQIVQFNGSISAGGTHVYKNSATGISWASHKTIDHDGVLIGTIAAADNDFFQRACTIPIVFFCQYYVSGTAYYGISKGRFYIYKHSDNDAYWDVKLINDAFLGGNTYSLELGTAYFSFDQHLDPWAT